MRKQIFIMIVLLGMGKGLLAQTDSTDLLSQLENEVLGDEKDRVKYTTATFKTTRLIDGHSVENVGKGVLDVKISHRFGKVNAGINELFGLDNATMRMGFDYGITNYLMIGFGRSTFEKTLDGFFKVKLLRQSAGKRSIPVTISYVPTVAYKSQKWEDPSRKNYVSSKLSFTHQLLIGRKFSEGTSLQIMPTFTHINLVQIATDPNDLYAVGIGGRQKINKRMSFNVEYYYQIPRYKLTGTSNALSVGFDIETGGHVFQLHFTNSQGMNEKNFITNTRGLWEKGDIFFGFNISRVFTVGKSK